MFDTDVLIVGGGASGLTASLLLSRQGIRTLLVSKHPQTSKVPKAHLLSIKTMEMYHELGLAAEIRAIGTPPAHMRYAGWYAGLAGPTPDHGREIARIGAWGRGHEDLDWRRASAHGYANLMQSRLEPLLKRHAETRAPGSIRFNHSFVALEQDESGVVATIEDRAAEQQYQVRVRYLLACDGGRAVGPQLGVEMLGHLAVATSVSVHFSADLSRWARGPDVLVRTLFNPDTGRPCSMVPMGPDRWGPDSPEWVLHFLSFPGDHKQFDHAGTIAELRRALGLPDLDPQVHVINHWPLDAVVASRFRVGRCFILGDAAHRMPPSGGHGLNTAVQDAYNLCWKLAAVLRGEGSDALLESYEAERRPVAERTVASAFANWQSAKSFAAALGFLPGRPAADIWQDLRTFWDGTGPDADAARRRVRTALAGAMNLYNHLNINYGHAYDAGALVADDTPAPPEIDAVQIYQPSTRAGRSLPHVTLQGLQGPCALGDLLGDDSFVLIVDADAGTEPAWRQAAAQVAAARGIRLKVLSIGHAEGEWLDMRREWQRVREIAPGGVVLVRPDRFIGWRALSPVADPGQALRDVFDRILMPAGQAAPAADGEASDGRAAGARAAYARVPA